jgi:hypothetical protein
MVMHIRISPKTCVYVCVLMAIYITMRLVCMHTNAHNIGGDSFTYRDWHTGAHASADEHVRVEGLRLRRLADGGAQAILEGMFLEINLLERKR